MPNFSITNHNKAGKEIEHHLVRINLLNPEKQTICGTEYSKLLETLPIAVEDTDFFNLSIKYDILGHLPEDKTRLALAYMQNNGCEVCAHCVASLYKTKSK